MDPKKYSPPTYVIPIMIIVAFTIIGFSFYAISKLDPGPKPGPVKSILSYGSANIGGKFSLKDTNNNKFTEKNLVGKISLLYFGFASCPDICPTTLQVMTNALNELPKELQAQVQPIFISIDPDRDTPEKIHAFISKFHANFIGLTGTEKEVENVAAAYKAYFNKMDPISQNDLENYNVDHSAIIYLIGRNGEYLKHFSTQASAENISNEIENQINK